MAKQTGLGDRLVIGPYDLSGDIGSLSDIAGGPTPLEVTGINKSGMERIGGVRSGGLAFTSFFNDAAGAAHSRFSTLPTSDIQVTYLRGLSLGGSAACLIAKQVGYDPSRGDDGSLTFKVEALANSYGLEWCTQLTPGYRTDSSATNGTGVDFGAASSFGLQAYLHVVGFSGSSATVKIQESSDNGVGDAWADVVGGTFTAVTDISSARIQTSRALSVERYLRAVSTGTFTYLEFVLAVAKNPVEVLL